MLVPICYFGAGRMVVVLLQCTTEVQYSASLVQRSKVLSAAVHRQRFSRAPGNPLSGMGGVLLGQSGSSLNIHAEPCWLLTVLAASQIQYASLCLLNNPGCLFIATNADARGHFTPNQEWAGAGATVGAIKGLRVCVGGRGRRAAGLRCL